MNAPRATVLRKVQSVVSKCHCERRYVPPNDTLIALVLFLFASLVPSVVLFARGNPRPLAGQAPSAEEILKRADDNAIAGNKILTAEMIIHGRRASRTVRSKSWIQGDKKSFTEYLDPPRERGTKMLKLGDQLWTYSPSTDRTILIAGHMLRQAVMDSDLSYEDLMEDRKLQEIYEAKVEGEEAVAGSACWVLELTAKLPDVAYPLRRVWVDKSRFVVLKENRYAKSGRLLKTAEVKSIGEVKGRFVPDWVIFKDVLKEGAGTEFKIEAIEFDAVIPDHVFSKASLRK